MAKKVYIGVADVAHKVKKIYIGVNGVARKVKKAYIGVNGVARQFYVAGWKNLIPGAVGIDGKTVFNETGYMNNTYLDNNTTTYHYWNKSGYVSTGFMWLPTGVTTIYVKGVTWNSSSSYCRLVVVNQANLGTANWRRKDYATSMPSSVKITTLGTKYYKFELTSPSEFTNAWLAMSFEGTGADLIVSYDEIDGEELFD